jgi:hypothetical protein
VRDVWAAARARRKALRAEVRRFTARQRRRRAIWITVGAALLALVLGTLGAAYSPLFAVEKVTVIGAQTLDAAAVEQALSGQIGTPLARVDTSAVKAALVQFPSSSPTRSRRDLRTSSSCASWSARRSGPWSPQPVSRWWMPRGSPSRRRRMRPRGTPSSR